ncbi:hypothetical protein Micbo1qcDRAFT_201646 [Microdochium bolleyi]|uniref:CBM1 domain-containing protein n=1 Tax=Microdochium bolleyi TaxID=196109 RepID=A0A136J957_9PEZI|nr:hypothetical protein Micbo1qcDRAFT_201646 [Microdochium bolleyi]
MGLLSGIVALASVLGSALAVTGPYGAANPTTVGALQAHTVYAPSNLSGAGKMPVFIWGNGACSADGTSVRGFLSEIASHGYLVISQGRPGGSGSSTQDQMRAAIAWAAAGTGGSYNVNTAQIMTAGFSCGGTEAYIGITDDRVKTIGILNSGLLSNYDQAGSIRKPIVFLLGGPSDIAYSNGERDYSRLPGGTPAWKGNLNRVGHGGTYYETDGGLWAKTLVNWLNWVFKGQAAGKSFLTGAQGQGFDSVVYKSLDSLQVPIGGGGGGGGGGGQTTTTTTQPPTTQPTNSPTCAALYGQCGGASWNGPKCCSSGTCKASNEWYSQCLVRNAGRMRSLIEFAVFMKPERYIYPLVYL